MVAAIPNGVANPDNAFPTGPNPALTAPKPFFFLASNNFLEPGTAAAAKPSSAPIADSSNNSGASPTAACLSSRSN